MSRTMACLLSIFCADVLLGSGQATHFDGLSVLLILLVDIPIVAFFVAPYIRAHLAAVTRVIANAENGAPSPFTGDPDEMLIAHAKRWGAEV